MLTFLANKKKLIYWIATPAILVGVFLLVMPAQANVLEDAVFLLLGWIVLPIIHFLGNVLLLLIEVLIGVFKFSEFIDTPAVQLGWIIIRDIANIGIVVALIVIAFSTVFRIKRYEASQLLVSLIIAAFLVNFSLIITGLIIDFGQVLMMYFVNAFSELAAGNLTVGLGLEQMLQVSESVSANPAFDSGDYLNVIGAMFLAVVLLIVAIAVIIVFLFVLLQRIVYLWLLAIFSPIAWVAPLLPGGDKWSGQWWSNFSTQVFIGPVLAFGFWLSMTILAGLAANQSLIALQTNQISDQYFEDNSQIARFVTEVSTPQAMFDFMTTIALLMGTIWLAKQAGGFAGGIAGTISGKLEAAPGKMLRRMGRPVTDRYRAYKGKREGVRQQGIQRFATKLSAQRDFLTVAGKKGRTRAVARGQRELTGLAQQNINDATTRYRMGSQDNNQLRMIMAGQGAGKGNEAARQAAAQQLSTRPNGLQNANEINQALSLFKASHLEGLQDSLATNAKKNSPEAATASQLYRDATGNIDAGGIENLLRDILNGTLDVRMINDTNFRSDIMAAAPNGQFMSRLTEGTRNGDHLEGLINKLDNRTKSDLERTVDLTGVNLSDDKRNSLARAGMVNSAFNKMSGVRERTMYDNFVADRRNRNKMFDNIAASSLEDRDNNHLVRQTIRDHASDKQVDDILEDQNNSRAMEAGLRTDIARHEATVAAAHGGAGTPAYWANVYRDKDSQEARAELVKITKNVADAYDTGRNEGRDTLGSVITRGKIRGGDVGRTDISDIPGSIGETHARLFAQHFSVSQLGDLLEEITEEQMDAVIKGLKHLTGVGGDLGTRMTRKLDSLEKNPRFTGYI